MSNAIGKRTSKWDLASESCHQADTGVSNSEVDNRSSLHHDKKSKSTWPSSRSGWDHDRRSSHVENFHSTEVKGDRWDNKNVKRSGRAYRENTSPPSRMRVREEDYAVSMSPGLDSWRESHRDRSRSPRNKWSSRSFRSRSRSKSKSYNRSKSRSRSRSPVHSFKRERERWKDRSENGSRGTIKPCKDFVSGRCKMGNQCQFLHDQYDGGKKNYSAILSGNREESRLERRYSLGYSHPNSESLEDAVDRSGGKSTQFCQRYERGSCQRGSSCNYVHRNSHDIFDGVRNIRHGRHERENRGVSAIPCKFFANGGCFNGDYCKFSHSLPGRLNTDRRLPDAQDDHHRRHDSRSRDDFSVVVNANSKTVPAFESRNEGKQNNDIPVKSASSDSLQWPVQNGSADFTAEMSMDEESRHVLRTDTIQISAHHMQTTNAYSAEHLPVNNVDSSEHFPLQNDEWRLRAFEKSPDHLPEAILDSQGQISLLDSSAIRCSDSHEVVQQTVLKLEGNSNFSVDAPSSSNVQIFSVQNLGENLDERNHQLYTMAPSAPSVVTIEELPRATEPAALGQMLGNGANLAKLYATLEALQPYPLANQGSLDLRSASHSNQYDPLSDGLVQASAGASCQPPISLLSITDEKCPVVEESQNDAKGYDPLAVNKGLNDKEGADAVGQVEGHKEKVFVQSKETSEIEVNTMNKENDTDASDDKAAGEEAKEEEKKSKSAKGDRMFKFSLAALVKEILKPTWREGQLSREAHKTIVKKVVDKITSSIRGSNIFQTQETIDSYLSHSKEKVSKLIQAYVEKYKTT